MTDFFDTRACKTAACTPSMAVEDDTVLINNTLRFAGFFRYGFVFASDLFINDIIR